MAMPASFGQKLFNVPYCTPDDLPQKMDLYFPDHGGPWPAVVYVHGGGWMSGDKSDGKGLANLLNPLGYMVASVNYRIAPEFRFPAFIEDVKCSIRFLRAHADQYHLNSQHIAAMGESAGGHMAALLGTTDQSAGWDVGEYLDQSSRIQAVIDLSGPADLTVTVTPDLEPLLKLVFGPNPVERADASPVKYVTAHASPFLIFHGDQDTIVDISQGQAMYDALMKAGASAKLVVVKNATHNMGTGGYEGQTSPNNEETIQIIVNFLEETLKSKQ
jgi:acetyl esterase/lipase